MEFESALGSRKYPGMIELLILWPNLLQSVAWMIVDFSTVA